MHGSGVVKDTDANPSTSTRPSSNRIRKSDPHTCGGGTITTSSRRSRTFASHRSQETKLKRMDGIGNKKVERKMTSSSKQTHAMTAKRLQALSKQELIERCRERNVNCYGTKFDMVQRLLSADRKGVLQEIRHKISPVHIKKVGGQYVHEESGLIFDPRERRVIGRRGEDGNVMSLRYNDIQTCLRYKFRYVLPPNLAESRARIHSEDEAEKAESVKVAMTTATTKTTKTEDDALMQRLQEIEEGVGVVKDDDVDVEDEEEVVEEEEAS